MTYAVALAMIATADGIGGYLLGMAICGVGFGMYMAVTSLSSSTCCPDPDSAAKDLGVLNIAERLPFALAPTLAPVVLGLSGTNSTRFCTSWPVARALSVPCGHHPDCSSVSHARDHEYPRGAILRTTPRLPALAPLSRREHPALKNGGNRSFEATAEPRGEPWRGRGAGT